MGAVPRARFRAAEEGRWHGRCWSICATSTSPTRSPATASPMRASGGRSKGDMSRRVRSSVVAPRKRGTPVTPTSHILHSAFTGSSATRMMTTEGFMQTLRHIPSDRRRAAAADRGAGARTMPPCWWRRPAPARPRACRWCCSTSRGRRTKKFWCWSRAGSRRAPPPRAWRRRWANTSATRSACACASARRFPSARASRW